jgi:hypothetical protein
MLRTVKEYITNLQDSIGAGSGAEPSTGNLRIEVDADNFPKVPRPPSWDKISKIELEKIYRSYLSSHYSMLLFAKPDL